MADIRYGVKATDPLYFYVAGPMTGHEEYNYPLFKRVTAWLRSFGYRVECPTELAPKEEYEDHATSLRKDLAGMLKCNAIAMLPGWESSRGATLELLIALVLAFDIYELQIVAHKHENAQPFMLQRSDIRFSYVVVHLIKTWFTAREE